MSTGTYKQVDVICPFYKRDDLGNGKRKPSITCEGIIDGSSITQKYDEKKDYLRQIDAFCSCNYKFCELYRLLMTYKYEEDV